MAAHLHDGVLQTLGLIQKRAGDDKAVRSLARRQERELRSWLYGVRGPGAAAPEPNGNSATVATLLRRELDDVEDHYGVRLDAVLVGDAPIDEAGRALVAAGREAALNAARHAGVDTVDVYLEVEPERLSLFVRDRGRGAELIRRVLATADGGGAPTSPGAPPGARPSAAVPPAEAPPVAGDPPPARPGTARAPVPRFLALSVSDAAEDVISVIRAGARGS